MKQIYTYTGLIVFALMMLGNSGGRANMGFGASGAPGDGGQFCGSSGCHSSGAFTVTQTLELLEMDEEVFTYLPGQMYQVRVTNNSSGSPAAYGFQMVSKLDNDDSFYNTWENPGDNVHIVNLGNRSYAEQSSPNPENNFTVEWTAPPSGSGPVTFYFAGNAVNGNGSPSGDGATKGSKTYLEEGTSSFSDVAFDNMIMTYPNPVDDILFVELDYHLDLRLELWDMAGKLVNTKTSKTDQEELNMNNLTTGLYILNVSNPQEDIAISRLIYKL